MPRGRSKDFILSRIKSFGAAMLRKNTKYEQRKKHCFWRIKAGCGDFFRDFLTATPPRRRG